MIVLKNINIIPMSKEEIIKSRDVLLIGDKIHSIGENFLDTEYETIDCTGKYLIPGLHDMHVHLNMDDMLVKFIYNGVTTVRNMWGFPLNLKWKKEINEGSLIGPNIYSTSQLLDGVEYWKGTKLVTKPEEVEELIEQIISDGYDWVKTYPSIPRDAYFKIMETAEEKGIKVVGHGNSFVSAKELAYSGYQCIEHTNCLLTTTKEIDELDYYTDAGMWFCPTQIVVKSLYDYVKGDKAFSDNPDYKYNNQLENRTGSTLIIGEKVRKIHHIKGLHMRKCWIMERGLYLSLTTFFLEQTHQIQVL